MQKLVITAGHVLSPEQERFTDITLAAGVIERIGPALADDPAQAHVIDASNCWVTPGLIDLQVNGGQGCNFWDDPEPQQIAAFSKDLARAGVTTILPTLITDELSRLE